MLRSILSIIILFSCTSCQVKKTPSPNIKGNFTLALAPESLNLFTNQSTQFDVLINRNSFTETVNLAVDNVPDDISITPTSVKVSTNKQKFNLVVGPDAKVGNYQAPITGTSKDKTAQTTLDLNVLQGSFTLTVEPNTLDLFINQNTSFDVLINRNSFTETVSLTVDNLPADVSITPVATNVSTDKQKFDLAVGPNAKAGNYQISITGTGGSKASQAILNLKVAEQPQGGFTLTAQPDTLDLLPNQSASFEVLINRNSFTENVNLTLDNLPEDVSVIPASANVSSDKQKFDLTVGPNAKAGDYQISITGTGGSKTAKATLMLKITEQLQGGFTLTAEPNTLDLLTNQSASFEVLINRSSFAENVNLTLDTLPADVSITPVSANVSTDKQKFDLTAGPNAKAGNYQISITGTDGSKTAKATLMLKITEQPQGGFTLTAEPNTLDLLTNQSASFEVLINRSSFAENVNLTLDNLPAEVSITPVSANVSTDKQKFDLTAGPNAKAGNYQISITGTGRSKTAKTSLNLQITEQLQGDFTLTAEPNTLDLLTDESASFEVLISRNSFTKKVNLTVDNLPENISTTPASVSISGDKQSFDLTVGPNAKAGDYQISITGTGGSKTSQVILNLKVTEQQPQGSFTLSAEPNALDLLRGESAFFDVLINRNSFTENVSLTVDNLPADVSITPVSANVSTDKQEFDLNVGPNAKVGDYQISITGTGGGKTSQAILNLKVTEQQPQGSFTLSAEPNALDLLTGESAFFDVLINRNSFTENVSLTVDNLPADVSITPVAANVSANKQKFDLAVGSNAKASNYQISITGTGGSKTSQVILNLKVTEQPQGGFTLTAEPYTLDLLPNQSASFEVLINRSSFTETVSLTVDNLPENVSVTPVSANVSTDKQKFDLIAGPNAKAGNYQISVIGTGRDKTSKTLLNLKVSKEPQVNVWRPKPNTSWQWQLDGEIDTSFDVDMYDIDLFDAPQSIIDNLHKEGRIVICYFSAGSFEPWREDAGNFPESVKAKKLEDFEDERWLDISKLEVLAPIMRARLDLAVQKDCDGVEPDNVDGYTNDTGKPLTSEDQLNYNLFLAKEAHARGLSIGLKNDLEQVLELEPHFDWALNEQCFQYNECDKLLPFIKAGKAVFGVEYEIEAEDFCPLANAFDFDFLKKDYDLKAERIACR